MPRRALTLLLAVWALGLSFSSASSAATRIDRGALSLSTQSDLIALVNAYRVNNGLQVVYASGALTAAAAWMAGDMAAKNYIAHVSTDGRSPTQRMSAFGYPATSMYTGEDLGAGYATAGAVLAGWQTSAAHNAVLLNPNYNAIGVGLVYNASSTYKWYWAADFGGPGGVVKVLVPPAPQPAPAAKPAPQPLVRAAPAPRGSESEARVDIADPEAAADAAGLAAILRIDERRMAHLLAALARMGEL